MIQEIICQMACQPCVHGFLSVMLRQPKRLRTFHCQQRHKDEAQGNRIALARQCNQAEGTGQGREYHQQYQQHRGQRSHIQLAVGERADLEQRVFGAHIESLHHLRKRQNHKRHRLAASQLTGDLLAEVEGDQGQRAEHDALDNCAQTQTVSEDTLVLGLRLLLHDVILNGLHAQRDSGQTVGNKVDPQQLH